jgi:small subunit ribosomal protein S2
MTKLPGVLVAIDVNRETNALREARNLGIPTICLLDTDGDPDLVDIPVPGNDDSMRSIAIFVREICSSVSDGRKQVATQKKEAAGGDDASEATNNRRRSSRSQFRAEEPTPAPAEESAPEADAAPSNPEVPAASDG